MTTMALTHHSGRFASVALDISDVREALGSNDDARSKAKVRAVARDPDYAGALHMPPPSDIPVWMCAKLVGWLAIMILMVLMGVNLGTFGSDAVNAVVVVASH